MSGWPSRMVIKSAMIFKSVMVFVFEVGELDDGHGSRRSRRQEKLVIAPGPGRLQIRFIPANLCG